MVLWWYFDWGWWFYGSSHVCFEMSFTMLWMPFFTTSFSDRILRAVLTEAKGLHDFNIAWSILKKPATSPQAEQSRKWRQSRHLPRHPLNAQLMIEGFTRQKYRVGCTPLQILPLLDEPVSKTDQALRIFNQMLPNIRTAVLDRFISLAEEPLYCYNDSLKMSFQ